MTLKERNNMEQYSDKELVSLIFQVDDEFAGETLFLLIQEACKRNLTLTFKDNKIVYNRC